MTLSVGALFAAVEHNNYALLWSQMQAMTQDEMMKAGTAIGPMAAAKPMLMSTPTPAATPETLIPEILA